MKKVNFGVLVVLTTVWVGFSGCSSDGPTGPGMGSLEESSVLPSTVVSQSIGSAGGTLATAEASLEVSTGSLSSSTVITLTTSAENSTVVVDADVSSFSGDVKLALELPSGADPNDQHHILEYIPLSGVWNSRGGLQSGNTISISIDHPATFQVSLFE